MNVFGVDPGFASLGWAVLDLGERGHAWLAAGCIRTQKTKGRRVDDDVTDRAGQIARQLREVLRLWPAAMMAAEHVSSPRNSSAARKVGVAWGIVIAEVEARRIPLVALQPQMIRTRLGLPRGASKAVVWERVEELYPGAGEKAPKPMCRREHALDAAAAIVAALDTELGRAIVRAAGRTQ